MRVRCARCRKEKNPSLFHKNTKNRTGCASWCKDCRKKGNLPGDPTRQQKLRLCTSCGVTKKTSEFRSQATPDTPCLSCLGGRRSRFNYPKTPEKHRRHREEIKALYGLDEQTYYELLKAQSGKCPGCGEPPNDRNLAVDHCHAAGVVRGLLCIDCNLALGRVKDSVETLRNLISYLLTPTCNLSIPEENLIKIDSKRVRRRSRSHLKTTTRTPEKYSVDVLIEQPQR